MDRQPEPIAICGMALRLPGALTTPAQFWQFLTDKKDARARIPLERFDAEAFHSVSGKSGYINSQHGYFLDKSAEVGAIDTSFFRMSQQESQCMDPQQKILLELARECFESAGETNWRGRDVGTYIGSFGNDWAEMMTKDPLVKSMYKATGHGDFMLANRVSYEYDLKGPSVTVRTACSASLVGLHEACIAVRNGDCSAALVGGCNMLWSPDTMSDMSEQGVISLNASCRTFDAAADGYARGEAVNMIYIKSLSAAIRDGNPVRAIIRGTATNSDGKTAGVSLPSSLSQEEMIRKAYHTAGIPECDITRTAFVECHGTSTPTGDPIETVAVGNVFGNSGVYIGSVKPNVGHSEGASGITSIIKAVLALENRIIPPNIKFETPNPKIPFLEMNLRVPTDCIDWPEDKLERISVNSFGIGGANAHVILESVAAYGTSRAFQCPEIAVPVREAVPLVPDLTACLESGKLFLTTANTSGSLQNQIQNLRDYGLANKETIDDISYTLACRREHLPHRAFVVVQGFSFTASNVAFVSNMSTTRLAMVFTGQGAQWARMGIELLHANPIFASSIKAMDCDLRDLPLPPSWSIHEELDRDADSSNLGRAAISQPLCTAVQVALVDALADLAIKPHYVLGHSSGEIAAAYAAGRISRRAAITFAYYRGIVSEATTRSGAMAVVGLGWDEVATRLPQGAVIACNNSESNVTISGDEMAVRDAVDSIQARNPEVFVRMLKVNTAYHSHHMLETGDRYECMMKSFSETDFSKDGSTSGPNFFSSVSGRLLPASERVDAQYFRRNLESPVLFLQAFESLLAHCKDDSHHNLCLLEIGPHSALSGPIRQMLTKHSLNYPYVSCLQRDAHANKTLLTALGTLWQHGVNLDLHRLTNPSNTAKVLTDVPSYPWNRDGPHIFHNRIIQMWRYPKFPHHELLGSLISYNTREQPSFRNILELERIPWLRDHNIDGDVVLPCAAYVTMAGEACRRLYFSDQDNEFFGFSVKNMVIGTALILEEKKPIEIITSFRKWRITDNMESNGWEFTISSCLGTGWTKHCSGSVEAIVSSPDLPPVADDAFSRKTEAAKWYQAMWRVGGRYGPSFQGLKDIQCAPNKQVAKAIVCDKTPADSESKYLVHPTTIDVFFQTVAVAAYNGKGHAVESMNVPTFIKQMDVYDCPGDLQVYTSANVLQNGKTHGWGCAFGSTRALAMSLDKIQVTPLDTSVEADPHAGALTTWTLDPGFTTMAELVVYDTEADNSVPLLRELTSLHIQNALEHIQGKEPASDTMRNFVAWMKRQSVPDTLRSIETVTSEAKIGPLSAIAHAMEKITDNIVGLITNQLSPLELLMADKTLTDVYRSANTVDRKAYLQLLGHQKPNMRILEIGAGTGGTTREILSSLVNESDRGKLWASYTYTDISAGFFSAAKESFKDDPALEYKVLDITKDPITQGFQPHYYDLIIATNVIHAVPSLQQALRNVHALLQQDGTFYLEELCSDVKALNFIMGLFSEWWHGQDDGRANEPYVQPERWDRELRAAGFTGVVDHILDRPQPNQINAVMITYPMVQEALPKPLTLLFDDSTHQVAIDLKTELSQTLQFEILLQHWDKEKRLPKRDLVCLLDVNQPFFMDIDVNHFDKFRDLLTQVSESKDGILWLTRSSQLSCEHPRWGQTPGAMRAIREDMGIDIAICEVDRLNDSSWKAVTQVAQRFSRRHISSQNLELEYAIEKGRIYVPRIYPFCVDLELRKPSTYSPTTQSTGLQLTIGAAGRLDTLQWTTHSYEKPEYGQVSIDMKATGLNFRVMLKSPNMICLGLDKMLTIIGCAYGYGPPRSTKPISWTGSCGSGSSHWTGS
jgi:acyl transferase domain-containing protein